MSWVPLEFYTKGNRIFINPIWLTEFPVEKSNIYLYRIMPREFRLITEYILYIYTICMHICKFKSKLVGELFINEDD